MQMCAKRFSKLFNQHSPPKAVDFLLAFVIELTRDGQTLHFCVERAIERGAYVKHNNNAGNLVGNLHRATPNAFSRFSFSQSGGECMVVDIQGVEDLYTDPQIHSVRGDDFGDGAAGEVDLGGCFARMERGNGAGWVRERVEGGWAEVLAGGEGERGRQRRRKQNSARA